MCVTIFLESVNVRSYDGTGEKYKHPFVENHDFELAKTH
jgi:hypothetical protein